MNPIVQWINDVIYIGLEKFGRYYSVYRALVANNEDPSGLHKLQLLIPGIANNKMDKWVPPVNVFYGINWGMQCIPPIGSTVWVQFEKGDPNHPLWMHGYPGKDDIKATPPRLKSVNNFWFQTPQGTIIELNDDLGTFLIQDAWGNIIQSSKKGISMMTVSKGVIYQGSIDKADQPATLGDSAQDILTRHNDELKGLNDNVNSLANQLKTSFKTISLAAGPIPAAIALLNEAIDINSKAGAVKDACDTRNNTMDLIKKDIPKIKSGSVRLDK